MVRWILTVVVVCLFSYLADVGVFPILREPAPFFGGSTISVVLMVCCIGMLARVARLSRRREKESLKRRVDHLEENLQKLGEYARDREVESIFRSWQLWRSKSRGDSKRSS